MECNKLQKYLKKHKSSDIDLNIALKKHIGECTECKKFFSFIRMLHSRKDVLEKAPNSIVYNVRHKIHDLQESRKHAGWKMIFGRVVKPTIAFIVFIITVAVYIYCKNSPIGCVDNLADRFNIHELKSVYIGDILYVAKNSTVFLRLNNDVKLQANSNTLLKIRKKDNITLSRGQLYISIGDKGIKIATPNGVISAKNTKTKIHTMQKEENGIFITKTSCVVLDGIAEIINSEEKVMVPPGQEFILAAGGEIERKYTLASSAFKKAVSKIDVAPKMSVISAREMLCNCIYNKKYDSSGASGLHGNEVKENKFPVRIFWRNIHNTKYRRGINEIYCHCDTDSDSVACSHNCPGI